MSIHQHSSIVSYGGVNIGTHSVVMPNVEKNIIVEQIPRAVGVYIKDLGGGLQTMTVQGWITQDTRERKILLAYIQSLEALLVAVSAPATLTDVDNTFLNCFFQSIAPSPEDKHFNHFNATFLRSIA